MEEKGKNGMNWLTKFSFFIDFTKQENRYVQMNIILLHYLWEDRMVDQPIFPPKINTL